MVLCSVLCSELAVLRLLELNRSTVPLELTPYEVQRVETWESSLPLSPQTFRPISRYLLPSLPAKYPLTSPPCHPGCYHLGTGATYVEQIAAKSSPWAPASCSCFSTIHSPSAANQTMVLCCLKPSKRGAPGWLSG